MDITKIIGLKKNNPANTDEINSVEVELGVFLPKVYRQLLSITNGFINGQGIGLYGTDELVERNQTWEVDKYARGYVAIGDNSGGKVFLMEADRASKEVIAVDSGYMNPKDEPEVITNDLSEWISTGCSIRTSETEEIRSYIELHNIILEKMPVGGTKDLLVIKKILEIDISIGELLKCSKQPPFILVRNVPYAKAISRIKKLGQVGSILRLEPSSND
ncbi:SMI1/KNR4 family protein [Ruminiclostridium papyrosolvens]|uniref:Knr4/Smi1-like domain-containing protein n=1 Tax=Ruminiclostridium papyrosolvens C7 TaxID=1330534 RepID=U4R0V3_9FIRM|nr:SMI1/KNR4 family protein [Ruminiclostridium papyrosolvens]EPR11641.1 hypothetical protein L323_11580 [Ruminiclostridium papyrosolvens C7]